jgi:hypothetical protein
MINFKIANAQARLKIEQERTKQIKKTYDNREFLEMLDGF